MFVRQLLHRFAAGSRVRNTPLVKILPFGRAGGRRRSWGRRPRRRRAVGVAATLAVVAIVAVTQFTSQPVAGASSLALRAIDGDTVEIIATGERVRLANIDTPETGDRARCAAERRAAARATSEVRALLNSGSAHVRYTGRIDTYGRKIGYVTIDGRDLGRMMIARGLARAWRGRREPWCGASGELIGL